MNIKYTFYPHSVPNLMEYVDVEARNYIEAKHKVMKNLSVGKEMRVSIVDAEDKAYEEEE